MLTILIGISGSGKTYYAQHHAKDTDIVSIESVKAELTADLKTYTEKTLQQAVYKTCVDAILLALENKRDIIFDARNLTKYERKRILSKVPKGTEIRAIVFDTDYDTCCTRLKANKSKADKIFTQKKKLQLPSLDEGFKQIMTLTPPNK